MNYLLRHRTIFLTVAALTALVLAISAAMLNTLSAEGMMNGLGLTQWVWSGRTGLHLGELIAA